MEKFLNQKATPKQEGDFARILREKEEKDAEANPSDTKQDSDIQD